MRYPYADILSLPAVPRLLSAAVIGRMPVGMGALALFLFVRGAGGSYAMAGLAVGASTVAGCVGAPLLGRLVDRQGQTRIMLPSMLVQVTALLLLAITAPGTGVLLFGLCALYGFSAPPLAAAMRATWASLIDDRRQIGRAFTLDATAQEVIWILGPVLAAVLAEGINPRAPLIAMAAFSATGVVWFATSAQSRTWRAERSADRHLLGPLGTGPVRRVLLSILGLAFAWGALELAIPAYAEQNDASAGVLLSIWAVGSVIGGLGYAARTWGGTPQRMMGILLGLNLVSFLILFLSQTPLQLGILLLLTGVVNAPVIATFYVLIEELTPAGSVTEAFTWISTTFLVGISGGVALAGIVADVASPRTAWWLAVGGGVFAVLTVVIRHRGLHAETATAKESA
ncbi:MAG: MFS transporter [Gaiellales bacterium]|nr:MFS transporter [Gaiellales bacterium]